jgi:hypothetical protein
MPETITKAVLLDRMQTGYTELEALLAPLSQTQMTTSDSNDPWSIKDHIAHFTIWQSYLLEQLQGILLNTRPRVFMPGLSTVDEVNERFYYGYKDHPLAEVLMAFCASYQRVLATVEALSEEALNAPFRWREDVPSVWSLIAEVTYEHYQEHGETIRHGLGRFP